ncbi:AraC family transcriptional regulator [Phytoactinopolyspora limicola]|uniref:AraC family transcriptional regulator n=1 Tax=Phytoactinopolyspora limicola TaxID=2715536 RepID=UPI00140A96F8|nr:AraC family transcriptional regulator [Phytoactinopolyspora limicola]
MLDGTLPPYVVRLLIDTLRRLGVPSTEFARLPGLEPDVLKDDLIRIPTESAMRLWDLLAYAGDSRVAGALVADSFPAGYFDSWGYLLSTGENLHESLQAAHELFPVVTDPGDVLSAEEDGSQFVIRYRGPYQGQLTDDVASLIDQFVLRTLMRLLNDGRPTPLTPARLTLAHPSNATRAELAGVYGTGRIEVGGGENTMTLLADDVMAPLPRADTRLFQILRRHTTMRLEAAKHLPAWEGRLQLAIESALSRGTPSLETVAHSLAVSPRTLQRQLQQRGTTWRQELDQARHAGAVRLLRDSRLSVQSIAARLEYADARAFRRAFQRWTGQTPDEFRRTQAAADRLTEARFAAA